MSIDLYKESTFECSKLITNLYSTSFSIGIKTLDKRFHQPIYAIYGFVRYADEIVDTFHDHNKKQLLYDFRSDTFKAINSGISMNPVLHSFQYAVNKYHISNELINSFLDSMEMDLNQQTYLESLYKDYIYGSAEVVGLMCLQVFCEGDPLSFERLKIPARHLGAAFQKINFLRDMGSDFYDRGRIYFPKVDFYKFNADAKKQIEEDIQKDLNNAYGGVISLPEGARRGVYLSYLYYVKLFNKIKKTDHQEVLRKRIRVSNLLKLNLLMHTYLLGKLNIF